jgi:predicted benzoate:H+ symporter BenE
MQVLQQDSHGASYDRSALLLHSSAIIFGFIPLLIVALISKMDPGSSSFAQRSWLMTWVVFGAVFGPIIEWRRGELMSYGQSTWSAQLSTISLAAFYAAPAIGGFVVVGQMIMDYGTCIQLD